MTLITGVYCKEGLLIAGDREESGYGGKRSVQKIFRAIEKKGKWVMVIGTAGNSALGDKAMRRICTQAEKLPLAFIAKHIDVIETVLRDIYDKYIRLHNLSAYEKQSREFSLIVGIKDMENKHARFFLYRSEEEVLSPSDDFVCAGKGEDIANYFLDRLRHDVLTGPQLGELILFIIREAKDSVEGVGKETESYFLPSSGSLAETRWTTTMSDLKLPTLAECLTPFWLKPSIFQTSEPEP